MVTMVHVVVHGGDLPTGPTPRPSKQKSREVDSARLTRVDLGGTGAGVRAAQPQGLALREAKKKHHQQINAFFRPVSDAGEQQPGLDGKYAPTETDRATGAYSAAAESSAVAESGRAPAADSSLPSEKDCIGAGDGCVVVCE